MQSFYLHYAQSMDFSTRNLQPFKYNNQNLVIGIRGNSIELYKLLNDDLTFIIKFQFHCKITKISVIPSKHHKYDFLFLIDSKGRFCLWHPNSIDHIDNTILWQDDLQTNLSTFSGVKYQIQQSNTQGNIFCTNSNIFILIKFNITQKGIAIDGNNVIKYYLQSGIKVRFVDWIKHSQLLFLIGMIVEDGKGTGLCVYDLERGLGIGEGSIEWRLEKVNLLQFYSKVEGQVLLVTFNQVSLYNYKHHYALKNYRTRGNYGQGFYLSQGFYGHIGEELIVFNRDKLIAYGPVKSNSLSSFTSVCLVYCEVIGKMQSGNSITLQTFQGQVYLLRIFNKAFTIQKIFNNIGPILEISLPTESNHILAVVTKSHDTFQLNFLQRQYPIPIRQQILISQKIQKMITINGGIFLIFSSEYSNEVYRLNRNQEYQKYFTLPQGNVIIAQDRFLVYQDGIYQIDYQSFAIHLLQGRKILLARIIGEIIYFLDVEGVVNIYDNQEGAVCVVAENRENDYCWGSINKTNTLLTANLLQPKQISLIHKTQIKYISIKGHTLINDLNSISSKINRYISDDRVLIGYVDGQIHMHSLQNDILHSVHTFPNYGSIPVTFYQCGDDTILANYTTKQYLITACKEQYKFTNISFGYQEKCLHVFGYLQKNDQICNIDRIQQEGFVMKKASLTMIKKLSQKENHYSLKVTKLQEWLHSVPLLLNLDGSVLVAGYNQIHLINLQKSKCIRLYHHGLKQIVSLNQIKMGIILCGIDQTQNQFIIILTQQLQLICKFPLHTKKPLRRLIAIQGENNFFLAYDDYLTLYRISQNLQMISVMGINIHMQAYQIDFSEEHILANDPFSGFSIFKLNDSISYLGNYIPPYKITHLLFIGNDILYADERGSITILATQIQETIDFKFKFNRVFSLCLQDQISTLYRKEDSVYYATQKGQIGVIKIINRDEFDTLKKLQTQTLLEMDESLGFCYWQWRNRSPAHERIIDGQMFLHNQSFISNYKS